MSALVDELKSWPKLFSFKAGFGIDSCLAEEADNNDRRRRMRKNNENFLKLHEAISRNGNGEI